MTIEAIADGAARSVDRPVDRMTDCHSMSRHCDGFPASDRRDNAAALVDALKSGQLAGAAIDVLAKEPPVDGDPVLDYGGGNLIVTPHIAWATNEARQNAIDELAANAAAFMRGQRRNRVV